MFRPCSLSTSLISLSLALIMTLPLAAQERIGRQALDDIAALLAEKANRTPTQQKIASSLLHESMRRAGDAVLLGMPHLQRFAGVEADGRVLIDVHALVDDELLARVATLGGEVEFASVRFSSLRLRLALDRLEMLAASPKVRWIRPADVYMLQVTSQGDVAHAADQARTTFAVDGTGVTACAMSDSVDALADLQTSGELPPGVTVLPGQSGNPGTSEGTALLEIIHDLAPGADLFFATGRGGEAQMAQNILDLAAAGCDVIVDDVLYLAEPVFQDGIIAQVVDQVTSEGVLYFTSAGNSGNLTNGTSGVFEGDFDGIALPPVLAGQGFEAHDFGGGDTGNNIDFDPPALITLQWSDPFNASDNDYDLFLLSPDLSTVVAASTLTQNGGAQVPVEFIISGADHTDHKLVVTKSSAGEDDVFIHLNTHRGRLEHGTNGQIFGHPGALGAFTVGAVDVATANGGVFTGGAANPVEFFSSDGPRRIFFNPDGSPVALAARPDGEAAITKGTQASTVRQKPDMVAADGVSTTTPGFDPFFGSSASAPHSAAIAALFSELFGDSTSSTANGSTSFPDLFADAFESTALDIEAPGFDNDSGAGILMSDDTLNAPIFADGFESGNTSAWTDSAP